MKAAETFFATLYIGSREHYDGILHNLDDVEKICQDYVDDVGLCITITPTKYVYKNGNEDGCAIGLINYPRFPSDSESITRTAVELATILMKEFNQYRVSIVTPNQTITLENE